MTNIQKNEIVKQIHLEKERLGSANKLGITSGVSPTSISHMLSGKWDNIAPELWQKIAKAVGYKNTDWQIIETTNYNRLSRIMGDAKEHCLFYAVSHKAGSGKSATINSFADTNNDGSVFKYQAREVAKREFLFDLCKSLGIKQTKGYSSVHKLEDLVINFFVERAHFKPLLIIDEADKLRPSALRFFIPLYNALEDKMGCVICGTENLEKEIKRGVRSCAKGYDEIDDRFGRNFIHLIGARLKDVEKICRANGISDKETQRAIFIECEPVSKLIANKNVRVIESMRRLKRVVKRELMKQALSKN